MIKIANEPCKKCLGTGQVWNGEEMEECGYCDGESVIENYDSIIDIDDLIEPPEEPFDEW